MKLSITSSLIITKLYIHTFSNTDMSSLLYFIAVILVIAWLIGFVGYGAGGLIHALLVLAIIAVLFRLISGRRPVV